MELEFLCFICLQATLRSLYSPYFSNSFHPLFSLILPSFSNLAVISHSRLFLRYSSCSIFHSFSFTFFLIFLFLLSFLCSLFLVFSPCLLFLSLFCSPSVSYPSFLVSALHFFILCLLSLPLSPLSLTLRTSFNLPSPVYSPSLPFPVHSSILPLHLLPSTSLPPFPRLLSLSTPCLLCPRPHTVSDAPPSTSPHYFSLAGRGVSEVPLHTNPPSLSPLLFPSSPLLVTPNPPSPLLVTLPSSSLTLTPILPLLLNQ